MLKSDRPSQFTLEQKTAILRRHMVDGVSVSDLCKELGLESSLFYHWQRQMFDFEAFLETLTKHRVGRDSRNEWKPIGDSLYFLAMEATNLSLSAKQLNVVNAEALRIYLAHGRGTYHGGAALNYLQAAGTGEAVRAILDHFLTRLDYASEVEAGLRTIQKILERDAKILPDSYLIKLTKLGPIAALRTAVAKQYEPDEIRETWDVPANVDCKAIRELAVTEINRRRQRV
jgi:hypothetical protein